MNIAVSQILFGYFSFIFCYCGIFISFFISLLYQKVIFKVSHFYHLILIWLQWMEKKISDTPHYNTLQYPVFLFKNA